MLPGRAFGRYVRIAAGKTMADKFYIGFFDGAALVAVVDMILAYPNETTGYIGFFMVDKSRQGQGIGQPYRSRYRKYYAQQWYVP